MPRQCEWCMPTSRKCRRSFDRSARADSSLNAASNFCGRSAFSLLELVVVVGVVGEVISRVVNQVLDEGRARVERTQRVLDQAELSEAGPERTAALGWFSRELHFRAATLGDLKFVARSAGMPHEKRNRT